VYMALLSVGIDTSYQKLMDLVQTKSVWTVDLCRVLSHFKVEFFLYTLTAQADASQYRSMPFYCEELDNDTNRVNSLFPILHKRVITASLSLTQFLNELHGNIAIVLVDSSVLKTSPGSWLIDKIGGRNYIGHYILVVDYDQKSREFIYRDPSCQYSCWFRLSELDFERARKSKGTDEDVVMIPISKHRASI